MSAPMIRIHDLETNQIVDREMTQQEHELHLQDIEESRIIRESQKAAEDAKALAREAVLAKLGLTAEEAAALLA